MTRCQAAGHLEAIDFIQLTVGANVDFYSENEHLYINVPVRSTYDGNTSPMTGLHHTLRK